MAFTPFIGKIGVRGQAKWSSGSWDASPTLGAKPQHGWSGFYEGVYPWNDAYMQYVEAPTPATDRGEFICAHYMIFLEGPVGAGVTDQDIVRADLSEEGKVERMPASDDAEKALGIVRNLYYGVPDENHNLAITVSGAWDVYHDGAPANKGNYATISTSDNGDGTDSGSFAAVDDFGVWLTKQGSSSNMLFIHPDRG